MIIEGKFTLEDATIQDVWEFLLKPETLMSCVPGAEKMEAVDDRTYDSVVKQKVGPVSAKFWFTTTLTELDPPHYLKAVGRGADVGKAGTFTQESTVSLAELSSNSAATAVEISYRSNVSLVGKLATFGDRTLRAKAKELEEELTKNLQERLRSEVADKAKG